MKIYTNGHALFIGHYLYLQRRTSPLENISGGGCYLSMKRNDFTFVVVSFVFVSFLCVHVCACLSHCEKTKQKALEKLKKKNLKTERKGKNV